MRILRAGEFIPQFKGTDLSKVPPTKLKQDGWFVGWKFDGNYIQIHKSDNGISMFTSGGKQFYITEIAEALSKIDATFIIEVELNVGSDGSKLNDRRNVGITKYTTRYKKGLISSEPKFHIHIFDVLLYNREDLRHIPYGSRHNFLNVFMRLDDRVETVATFDQYTLDQAKLVAKDIMLDGGEGAFCFHTSHTIADMNQLKSARSNYAIKIKASETAKMLAVDVIPSQTVDGEWGSIVLFNEDTNITQAFGGLTNNLRTATKEQIVGTMFTVRYESFTDGKYIQGFIYD